MYKGRLKVVLQLQVSSHYFEATFIILILVCKVSSIQEACAKCFAVHILKFKILQIT